MKVVNILFGSFFNTTFFFFFVKKSQSWGKEVMRKEIKWKTRRYDVDKYEIYPRVSIKHFIKRN